LIVSEGTYVAGQERRKERRNGVMGAVRAER